MSFSNSALSLLCPVFIFFLCFTSSTVGSWQLDPEVKAAQEADEVTGLPGQPLVGFRQYSGYITIDEQYGKALFYWFFEAIYKPAEKPLLLWLNGGPGCSSVGFGEAQELGPFLVKDDSTLMFNTYTWNKATNLLFLDSPVNVGFSYSNVTVDMHGDHLTALDAHVFLLNWFKRFPQYKQKEFYISGESYAGHYVPQLAKVIVDNNKQISNSSQDTYINLKGILIGNAVLDFATDLLGMVDYAWSHALISDNLHASILEKCDFSTNTSMTAECQGIFNQYNALYLAHIDMYSLYSPPCPLPRPFAATDNERITLEADSSPNYPNMLLRIPAGYDPCQRNKATTYFNRPDVQKALHANTTSILHPWVLCSTKVNNLWKQFDYSVLYIIRELIDAGIRTWVFSGDTDARVPVTATRYSLNKFALNITQDWTPWYNRNEIGGWTIEYEGLSFITIRGAGHQVPTHAPLQALQLVSHFLANNKLPSTPF